MTDWQVLRILMIPLVILLAAAAVFLLTTKMERRLARKNRRPALREWKKIGHDYELTFDDGSVYRGSCTVWKHYPTGEMCMGSTEDWLITIGQQVEWEEEAKENNVQP